VNNDIQVERRSRGSRKSAGTPVSPVKHRRSANVIGSRANCRVDPRRRITWATESPGARCSRGRRGMRCPEGAGRPLLALAAPRPHLIVLVQRRGCVHGPDRGIVDLGPGQRLGRDRAARFRGQSAGEVRFRPSG
jgi:hypothetical protein